MEKSKSKSLIYFNKQEYFQIDFDKESDFEEHITAKILNKEIFANYYVLEFKTQLNTESQFEGNVKADLVFIDKGYKYWVIVEVEYHSKKKHNWLEKHVVPQMQKITSIDYSNKETSSKILDFISENISSYGIEIDHNKLSFLIKYNQPNFLVLINEFPLDVKNWSTALYRCEICVMRCFKTYNDDYSSSYLYHKEYIKSIDDQSLCVYSKVTNKFTLNKPSLFYDFNTNEVDILVESKRNNIFGIRELQVVKGNPKQLRFSGGFKNGLYEIHLHGKQIIIKDKI